jgi:CheY-like chemotaxis protein
MIACIAIIEIARERRVNMSTVLSLLNDVVYPAPPSQAPMRLAGAGDIRANKRLRVLLVEDDDADVYLIRRALSELPKVSEVRVARDGVEALELLDAWAGGPDLAIVDLKMPRKDGFALLREIALRNSGAFPSVVLTSSKAGADAYRAKKRGAVEFVTKPNGLEKLKNVLGELVTKY